MLCSDCSLAGEYNKRGFWYQEHDRHREAEKSFKEAEYLHATCVNPASCTCQHSVGQNLVQR